MFDARPSDYAHAMRLWHRHGRDALTEAKAKGATAATCEILRMTIERAMRGVMPRLPR